MSAEIDSSPHADTRRRVTDAGNAHILMRPRTVLSILVAFYVLAAGGLAGLAAWNDYEDTLDEAGARTADIVRLLEEHASRTMDATDLMVLRVLDRVDDRGLYAIAESSAEWRIIRSMAESSPQTGVIYLTNAAGRVILASSAREVPDLDLSDRDFFQTLSRDNGARTIGQVSKDPVTGTYSFVLARKIANEDGGLGGVVAATVEVDYFKRYYQKLNLGPTAALGVYTMDGWILVRQPLPEKDVGRNMGRNPVYTIHMPEAPIGTYIGRSAYDGVVRVVSYRAAPEAGLMTWVSMAQTDALQAWRNRAYRNAGLAVGGLAMVLALAWLLLGGIRREERSQAALRVAATELEALNRELKRSNSDLEQFAYIASHDLREPLRSISLYLELLARRYAGRLDKDADEFIGYSVTGAKRLDAMINELLAYSRVETRAQPFRPLESAEVVDGAVSHLRAAIEETGAVIEVRRPLPAVVGEPNQLLSLFQNLIGNAVKYRHADRPPHIVIAGRERDDVWEFSVSDNGIGIEPQYHDRVFMIFKRLHGKDRYEGTGIGLAVCKRIVERHGGRIWIDGDEAGEGTTFRFTLARTRSNVLAATLDEAA